MPHIHAWKQLHGKNYLFWRGSQAQLVVTELELVKEILNNKDGAFLKERVEGLGKKFFGNGILVAEGEKWSRVRKIANHAFHGESSKGMIPAMIMSVETMLERNDYKIRLPGIRKFLKSRDELEGYYKIKDYEHDP
ncbi:hypothetical protein Vadar_027882 [Vaccinium darrowii]|uniref:Uncharacterized protein n=1 Tax=Vaccinium darrowii TaxID=229202 RepID=A0ACB7X4F5_9ERIC|nr:hypothetical protein Vadar_027882 [Vaccinium darrowii]